MEALGWSVDDGELRIIVPRQDEAANREVELLAGAGQVEPVDVRIIVHFDDFSQLEFLELVRQQVLRRRRLSSLQFLVVLYVPVFVHYCTLHNWVRNVSVQECMIVSMAGRLTAIAPTTAIPTAV